MPVEVNAVIQQQGRAGPIREIQVINEKEVRIITGLNAKQKVVWISLLALSDKSHIRLHIARSWLFVFLISIVALLGYLGIKHLFALSLGGYEFSFITILAISGLLGLVLFGLNLSRKRVFYSRHAGVPLFELLINHPDKTVYKTFMEKLHHYLEHARLSWQLSPEQQIAGEMKMLRRLANEGVISQRDYEMAKEKLFSANNKHAR